MQIIKQIAQELALSEHSVQKTVELIDDGNTIPFIARYRKEVTGSLDDIVLRELYDRLKYLRNLEQRKLEVSNSISEQGKMTEEIKLAIENAKTASEIEDIYRPFKQKKKTRASVAKENGLEPLALAILEQKEQKSSPLEMASAYLNENVKTVEDAISGARDIIAEIISDNPLFRKNIREKIFRDGSISSKAATEEDSVYANYYEFSERINKITPHKVLAVNRGEKEGLLSVSLETDNAYNISAITSKMITNQASTTAYLVEEAVVDAYKRLIFPSIEREIRNHLTDVASDRAIKIFGINLKNLLLTPPLKNKIVLGLDPAYRTGCKLAVIDQTGKVLHTEVIYPTPPQSKIDESQKTILKLVDEYKIEVVAIGNGTATKESEIFISQIIKEYNLDISYIVVSESGASVYSASKLASEEFPLFDVSLRSAVSIARRLQDPLAELVKIDPKAIGVGQYQHDMKPAKLDDALGGVVENCVNSVGVDVNTASYSLLSYVAGINNTVAKNIVALREEKGKFKSRRELKKVPKLGEKAYLQAAGFLRVSGGENILDNTAVHPESYSIVEKMLKITGYDKSVIKQNNGSLVTSKIKELKIENVAEELQIGIPTLNDILKELEKPGLDIRSSLPKPTLRSDILDIKDLKEGMILTGTVRNVVDFGVFVDISVHQDGLVHISEIADKFIRHPSEILSVGDIVKVKVLLVDLHKKRISLSMKSSDIEN